MTTPLTGAYTSLRGFLRQQWRDLLSVYYANTPTWRWLKSGTLVFFGFFLWMGGAVLLSVRPEWGVLTYVMAYGFLLVFWGPFTHIVVVPLTIRLRRTASHPVARAFSRNSGKLNLTLFFTLVIVFGALTPAVMMLEFSPGAITGDGTPSYSGELECDTAGDPITCEFVDAAGIDHVVVESPAGNEIARASEPPYRVTFDRDELHDGRTGKLFEVVPRSEDGTEMDRFRRRV